MEDTTAISRGKGCVLATVRDWQATWGEELGRDVELPSWRSRWEELTGKLMAESSRRCDAFGCDRYHSMAKIWSEFRKMMVDGKALPWRDIGDDGRWHTAMVTRMPGQFDRIEELQAA